MEVTLIYLHIIGKGYPEAAPPEYYAPFSERWRDTYRKYAPGSPHRVHVVFCGGKPSEEVLALYDGIASSSEVYLGAGSDIGACQFAIQKLRCDFVVCMSTPVYFHREGWLKKLVDAREFFGDGLYGPMASNEVKPHIRTSCWGVTPSTFRQYPHLIDTREKACWAEHADHSRTWQFTNWYALQGKQTIMVTWTGTFSRETWRQAPNGFRSGDQSDCLVRDQHWDVYQCSHYHDRLKLKTAADGG